MGLKRLLLLALAAWSARWIALELAAYAGHKLPRRPVDAPSRPPGWMPRRADSLDEG
jgi:hypothetical protein